MLICKTPEGVAQSRDTLEGLDQAGKVQEGSWEAEGVKEWLSQTVRKNSPDIGTAVQGSRDKGAAGNEK